VWLEETVVRADGLQADALHLGGNIFPSQSAPRRTGKATFQFIRREVRDNGAQIVCGDFARKGGRLGRRAYRSSLEGRRNLASQRSSSCPTRRRFLQLVERCAMVPVADEKL